MTPIAGQTWTYTWPQNIPGTISASTAPTLYVNGSASGATVTWDTSVEGCVSASVSLAGVSVGALVRFRGGSVTVDGSEYKIASPIRTVQGATADSLDTKLGTPTSASVSADIAAAQTSIDAKPAAPAIATQVRTELATELARIDATITSRLASASYTAPSSAAAIATQVRTELATELARLDATVSSRLATASYTSPSSAAAIATQVRSELATELARIDATITSRLAAAGYTAPDNAGISAIGTILVAVGGVVDAIASKFNGITSLAKWLRLMVGKTADATTLTEFRGDAAVNFDNTTDGNEAIRDRGDAAWLSGSGGGGGPAGAFAQTVTVQRSDTSAVVPNAVVRIGDAGTAWTGTTDGSGVATLGVDAGTYTITIDARGFEYTPTSRTISAVDAFDLLVVPNSITPASEPGKTTAYSAVFGGPARFTFELLDPTPVGSTTPATSWSLAPITVNVTTASVEVELYRSAKYRVRRDAGPWVEFTTGNDATYALPETLSQKRTV